MSSLRCATISSGASSMRSTSTTEIDRLERVGLLDDVALGRDPRAHPARAQGARPLGASMRNCGAASSTLTRSSAALDDARRDDELDRALELAVKRAPQLRVHDDETAKRRLGRVPHAEGLLGLDASAACSGPRADSRAVRRTVGSKPAVRTDVVPPTQTVRTYDARTRDRHDRRCSQRPRTYEVRTFGCQMNVHDSERLSGSLEAAGYVPADRRAGRRRRHQHLRRARERRQQALRQPRPPRARSSAARGRCRSPSAAASRRRTRPSSSRRRRGSTSSSARTTWARCRRCSSARGTTARRSSRSSSRSRSSPRRCRPSATRRYSGWVSISVGCNNTCTFCIVPALRGKEKDRRPGDILAEIQALVDDGAIEVTLLGQNVNSYGVEFGDRQAFGKLLRAAGHDRRARAHPLHEPAPGRLHRRRDRRDGRDARR